MEDEKQSLPTDNQVMAADDNTLVAVRKKRQNWRWTSGIILIVIVCVSLYLWMRYKQQMPKVIDNISLSDTHPLTGVPEPLQSMTIPALRERDYQAQLTVGSVLEENSVYTVYDSYYTSDNDRVYGLLAIPKDEPPVGGWPAIILVHGYLNPANYQTNGNSYRAWWQAVANSGEFVLFKPDLRGHGRSEGRPGGTYFGDEYVVDTLHAWQALRQLPTINPDAIGLWGHSMGGNVVLRSLVARPEIKAVALWAGAVYSYEDFFRYGITDRSYVPTSPPPDSSPSGWQRRFSLMVGDDGQPDLSAPFWQVVAPTNYLTDLSDSAVIIQHALDDDVVSYHYSHELDELLTVADIEHEYWTYPSGGHNLTSGFNQAISRNLDFFRRHLQPVMTTTETE